MNCYWILGLLLILVAESTCYNILFVNLFGGRSHKNALNPVAEELARRGHNITFISSNKETQKPNGIKENFLAETFEAQLIHNISFFDGRITDKHVLKKYHEMGLSLIDATYRCQFIQELIQNPRNVETGTPKYDIFVIDAIFNEYVLPIAHNMGVPVVYISPSIILPHIAWSLNIPRPYAYIPSFAEFMPGEMGFLKRLRSVYHNLDYVYTRFYYSYPAEEEIIRKYLPNAPSLRQLEQNISFLLSNDHFSITPRVPTMPYFVEVGGLHLKPAKKLPKDLQEFLDNSGDEGVIYFSLGSVTKGNSMPDFMRENIIRAFAKLKQKILWKYEGPLSGVSNNVKIVSWAPQNDVLPHPNLKLFITHGGGLSVQEAGYNGCPLLGIPLAAEQESNMANVVNAGFGETIEWKTFTVEEFVEKITKILNDAKYKKNAERVAKVLKDRPEHPSKTAAYWIEYVVRHDGAYHLKSGAENLNFFQYFLLDIIGVIAIVILTIFLAIALVLKKLASLLIVKQQQQHYKQKSKQN